MCRLMGSAAGIRRLQRSRRCAKHHLAPDPNDPVTMDSIWDDLAEKGAALDTAKQVQSSLSVIFYALAEGKITERRARILCYLLQTVLHAQRLIPAQEKLAAERSGANDIWRRLPACFRDDDANDANVTSDAAAKAKGDSAAPEAQTTVAGSAPEQASAPPSPPKATVNYPTLSPPFEIPRWPPPRLSREDQAELDRCDCILAERRWRIGRPTWRGG